MKFYHIAAVSENLVIGKDSTIPWRISGDLPRFQQITMGNALVMGRKTFQSMGKFALLKGRFNIVLSSQETLEDTSGAYTLRSGEVQEVNGTRVFLVDSLENAIAQAEEHGYHEVFFMGGERIYRDSLPLVDELRLTWVHQEVENGDAFYPEVDEDVWEMSCVVPHASGTHTYIDYVRKSVRG